MLQGIEMKSIIFKYLVIYIFLFVTVFGDKGKSELGLLCGPSCCLGTVTASG